MGVLAANDPMVAQLEAARRALVEAHRRTASQAELVQLAERVHVARRQLIVAVEAEAPTGS